MIGGVTRRILPHLCRVPPPPCKQALNSLILEIYIFSEMLCFVVITAHLVLCTQLSSTVARRLNSVNKCYSRALFTPPPPPP